MPGPTLTAAELGRELHRSHNWIMDNWEVEVAAGRLPPPLHGGKRPLTWSRAHVYATIDAQLPDDLRPAAAAYRAAILEIVNTLATNTEAADVALWRDRLTEQFGSTS